ncbi:MAG TPA: hypothetical protein VF336_04320, partial [Syntrophales bacterium]
MNKGVANLLPSAACITCGIPYFSSAGSRNILRHTEEVLHRLEKIGMCNCGQSIPWQGICMNDPVEDDKRRRSFKPKFGAPDVCVF